LALKSAPQAVELGLFTELVRFGLTDAESGVAAEILKGDGRLAAARRLGISDTTAKTHLSNIFEKTGTRRQAELSYSTPPMREKLKFPLHPARKTGFYCPDVKPHHKEIKAIHFISKCSAGQVLQ
jgi:DNA-binding CsgD family transcriptional regulator